MKTNQGLRSKSCPKFYCGRCWDGVWQQFQQMIKSQGDDLGCKTTWSYCAFKLKNFLEALPFALLSYLFYLVAIEHGQVSRTANRRAHGGNLDGFYCFLTRGLVQKERGMNSPWILFLPWKYCVWCKNIRIKMFLYFFPKILLKLEEINQNVINSKRSGNKSGCYVVKCQDPHLLNEMSSLQRFRDDYKSFLKEKAPIYKGMRIKVALYSSSAILNVIRQ